MTTSEHQQHLEHLVAAVQRRWGVNALRRLEQRATGAAGLPTGYADLDQELGSGGWPRGAVTCLSGYPTSGKTTLVLDALACAQAGSEVTVYIDLTGALDAEYAAGRGIDLDRLLVVWPQPPALGLDIARDLVTSGGAGLIVVDAGGCSDPAGSPSQTLRHLTLTVRRSPYAVLCLTSANSTSLTAALVARADLHLRVERQRWVWDTDGVTGYETRLTTLKSRFGPPNRSIILPITLGERRPGP
jgi:recombination protein RecA